MSEPLAIVEFELAWAPRVLSTVDYTYRERHGEVIYRSRACPREGGGRHAPERLLPVTVTVYVISTHECRAE